MSLFILETFIEAKAKFHVKQNVEAKNVHAVDYSNILVSFFYLLSLFCILAMRLWLMQGSPCFAFFNKSSFK